MQHPGSSEGSWAARSAAALSAIVLWAAQPAAAGDGTRFVPNGGQWPPEARFSLVRGGLVAWVLSDGFLIDRADLVAGRACAVRFTFEGAGASPPAGEAPLVERRSYLRGPDPDRWPVGLPVYARVRFEELLAGCDLVLREGTGLFEYDIELERAADLVGVVVRCEGGEGLEVDESGELVVHTALGELRQSAPRAFAVTAGGGRMRVDCAFRLLGADRFGFEARGADGSLPLTVDPGIVWSTFLGEAEEDTANAVRLDWAGRTLVAGATSSPLFPTTVGAYDATHARPVDAFVTCLGPGASMALWSTFLGGDDSDAAYGLALGPRGAVYLTGETDSTDFPTTPGAFDSTHNGGRDAFVSVLSPDGGTLVASTFLGGAGDERGVDLELSSAGDPPDEVRPFVGGTTTSGNFPITPGAFDPGYGGGSFGGGDGFVTRLAPDLGSLDWSTFLGGAGNDAVLDLAVDPTGLVSAVGSTGSVDFPVTAGAFDPTANGVGSFSDAFATRLAADGASLVWSTFLGGSMGDQARGVALGGGGEPVVVGRTESADFPVSPGAPGAVHAGAGDAFATRLDAGASAIVWSTLLGGAGDDGARAVAPASPALADEVVVVGGTRSEDFPATPWAFDAEDNNPSLSTVADAFVARLGAGGELRYASYLGGVDEDEAHAVAPTSDGGAIVAGRTVSSNFPATAGAFDRTHGGAQLADGFVTRLDFLRHPFVYGDGKQTSQGIVPIVGTGGFPSLAEDDLLLYIDLAIPFQPGWCFHGSSAADLPFMGGSLLVAPPLTRYRTIQTDLFGADTVPVPIRPWMVGQTLRFQFWFVDPGDAFGIGLSPGIEVLFYP
ncbi:MAG: hypothetical protein QF903_05010 [Planctomycetota bacterium]|jgi:hypothetical protein|nr:hypothetical protein [Planctomycetota bacterium]MDP6762315.1 hypothetical protein [Planctomycetota bacterium]MDP6988817.1 hypothetical protein [Planctomycetota bacterium]